jgi:hypothetical protein
MVEKGSVYMKPAWFTITDLLGILANPDQIAILLWCLGHILLIWFILRKYYVVVADEQVAVVYNLKKGAFACFWPAGRYLLLPKIEKLMGIISTAPESAKGISKAHTRDGWLITLEWMMNYKLNPCAIEPVLQPSMANILLSDPTRMAELHTNLCLQKIIERNTLEVLWQDGIPQKVNSQLTRSAVNCLVVYGIVVEEISINRVQWPDNRSDFAMRARTSKRLSEETIAHLAKPRPDLLNRSESTLVRSFDTASDDASGDVSSAVFNEESALDIDYYDSMARDIYQHSEIQRDSSIGKLVV